MAKDDKAKLKAQKREAKQAKKAQRKQTRSQMWQAFNMQRKEDKALIPLMLLAVVGIAVAFSSSACCGAASGLLCLSASY